MSKFDARAVFLGGVLAVLPGLAQAEDLLAHRAVYDLVLLRADSGSGISGLEGRFVAASWRTECGGWIVETRTVLDLAMADRPSVTTDRRTLGEEGPGRSFYRFEAATLYDGHPVERAEGNAEWVGDALRVHYAEPARGDLPIDPEALFPQAFSEELLKAARLGQRMVVGTVFDGSAGEDGERYLSAVLSRAETAPPALATLAGLPEGALGWQVSMAFFVPGGADALPVFRSRFFMLENGVLADLELDYGRYVLAGTLQQVTPLPLEACFSR
ncbi:MAG: DUF1849 family protein [Hyphomicrobiaceae bacterium]|nr:DUF1849 family protein [Hyphomicrobiaceae bacterium]